MTFDLTSYSNSQLQRSGLSLLSPPLSYASSEDAPFKPKDSDNISLSMKRRHRNDHCCNRRRRNRACLSSNDLNRSDLKSQKRTKPSHSRSMPCLRQPRTHRIAGRSAFCTARNYSSQGRGRRWTLPSKAAASRSVATPVTVESRQKSLIPMNDTDSQSPAMITLRRATTSKPKPKMSLTFFPPPKFSRTKPTFLSSFLSSITDGYEYHSHTKRTTVHQSGTTRTSRSASIDQNKAQPALSVVAQPVCTQIVDFEPTLSQPDQPNVMIGTRRCSTRYISGDSVYEIVWDENVSSGTSDAVPSDADASTGNRRRSSAVDKLESQLFRAVAQSRRKSSLAYEQEQPETNSEVVTRQSSLEQQSFQNMLAFKFSRFVNETALQELPRSKASTKLDGRVEECNDVSPPTNDISHIDSSHSLRSPGATGSNAPKEERAEVLVTENIDNSNLHNAQNKTAEMEIRSARRPTRPSTLGNLIGVSSHMRRNSAGTTWGQRQRSNVVNEITSRRPSVWKQQKIGVLGVIIDDDDDTVPLIRSSDVAG